LWIQDAGEAEGKWIALESWQRRQRLKSQALYETEEQQYSELNVIRWFVGREIAGTVIGLAFMSIVWTLSTYWIAGWPIVVLNILFLMATLWVGASLFRGMKLILPSWLAVMVVALVWFIAALGTRTVMLAILDAATG
jgi:hypothetical protein